MTPQTRTAVVAAVLFVAGALLISVLPVPFVAWKPGGTEDTLGAARNEPIIKIGGIATYPTTGRLDLTIVSGTAADSRLTLPEALLAYWLPGRDTLPREAVYPTGKSAEEVKADETQMMETSQDDAVVAALRAAGQPVVEMPAVASVTVGGPAYRRLQPGDLIESVDGRRTTGIEDVGRRIRTHAPGERVRFVVLRDRMATTVTVRTEAAKTDPSTAVVGIAVGPGYRYAPRISFDLGQQLGGPSAGLIFALAIYDKITPGPLLDGRHVAGTGTITADGKVGAIGGIQQKISAADSAGAGAFLVPAGNCDELPGVSTTMALIRVSTLADAIAAVEDVAADRPAADLPACP